MVPDQEECRNLAPMISIVNKRNAIVPKAPAINLMNNHDYPNRMFKSMFVSVVGGFLFEVSLKSVNNT